MPAYETNADGKIRAFTSAEIDAIEIETLGIEDGSSPTKSRRLNGSTERYEYLINADYFERFCAYMLGAAVRYTPAGGGADKISRLLPQTVPDKPNFAFIEVESATGHKFVNDESRDEDAREPLRPTYERMRVTLLAQHVMYDLVADDVGAERNRYVQVLPSQVDTQYLNLPGGVMNYYKSGGGGPTDKPIPYGIGFPVPMSTISRKWWRVPFDCWGEGTELFERVFGDQEGGTKPYLNSVNSVALFGYEPGYLQFLGVEEELVQDPLGDSLCWNLTLKWQAAHLAPHTWKYYYSVVAADAANNGWFFTAKKGATYYSTATLPDDTALHNARDHRLLFTVG
jgi:hypothetical protein